MALAFPSHPRKSNISKADTGLSKRKDFKWILLDNEILGLRHRLRKKVSTSGRMNVSGQPEEWDTVLQACNTSTQDTEAGESRLALATV